MQFKWNADPAIFTIPEITLPFSYTIPGLILGFIAFVLVNGKLIEKREKAFKRKEEVPFWIQYSGWWVFPVAILLANILSLAFGFEAQETLGPISPRWYGFLFAMAFVFGFLIGKKEFLDSGRTVEEMEQILMFILIATVIGARLGHVFFYEPSYYLRNPSEILMIWKGGLASHGAALAIIGTIWWISKQKKDMSFFWLADRVALPATLGGAFIRTGNFFNSEIVGKQTDVAWAVVFEQLGPEARHPSQLYEALCYYLIFALLWWIYRNNKGKPKEGLIMGLYLMLVFGARFIIEFTKSRQADFALDWALSMGQWLSIPVVLAGFMIWRRSLKTAS